MNMPAVETAAEGVSSGAAESSTVTVPSVLTSLTDGAMAPEIYRRIYVSLALPVDRGSIIGITSAVEGEGCTTVAFGLARTLAADLDTNVMLIDANLARPSLAERFGVPPAPGLSEVLRGEYRLEDVVRPIVSPRSPASTLIARMMKLRLGGGSDNLTIVTAGAAGVEASRLLRQLPLLDPLGSKWAPGVVILDLPPILNHSYSAVAASSTDALVLVIRAASTPIDSLRDAVERLRDRSLQGAVFNGERAVGHSLWRRRRKPSVSKG